MTGALQPTFWYRKSVNSLNGIAESDLLGVIVRMDESHSFGRWFGAFGNTMRRAIQQ